MQVPEKAPRMGSKYNLSFLCPVSRHSDGQPESKYYLCVNRCVLQVQECQAFCPGPQGEHRVPIGLQCVLFYTTTYQQLSQFKALAVYTGPTVVSDTKTKPIPVARPLGKNWQMAFLKERLWS